MTTDTNSISAFFESIRQAAVAEAATYIGLTLEAARLKAQSSGLPFRVGSLDGEAYMLTMDHVSGRVTVTVKDGVVTNCRVESL